MISDKIEIPNPCSENWNKMIPMDNGRHCNKCNKVVVDFTEMSDAEIISFLNKKVDTCGTFRTFQTTAKLSPVPRYLFSIQDNLIKKLSSGVFRKGMLFLIGFMIAMTGCQKIKVGPPTRRRIGDPKTDQNYQNERIITGKKSQPLKEVK